MTLRDELETLKQEMKQRLLDLFEDRHLMYYIKGCELVYDDIIEQIETIRELDDHIQEHFEGALSLKRISLN